MRRIFLKIKKKLPEPIKNILIQFYNKWNSKVILDKNMVKDLAEYFKLSHEETICMLKLGTRLNADLWHVLNPKTEKEIKNFYKITPYNIFDLTYWHMTRYQRRIRERIIKLSKGSVLDYGGGIGDLCIELRKRGFNDVTYADVYGKTFEFAKYLFQKDNYNIKMVDLTKSRLSKKYNTIICVDVIEHITNPKIILRELTNHLIQNGALIITGLDPPEISEMHPMHFKRNFNMRRYLSSLGLFKSDIEILWTKKI